MTDFSFYFSLGWHHIISWDAIDHILFLVALAAVYTLSNWKQVLVLVTAFTIGHSLTLFLSVFDIIRFNENWVEFLIPCTIVVTAIANLFQHSFTHKYIRLNYYLALAFGLIHGMGFANSIRFMLAKDQQLGISLLSFNAGLELGQITVVMVILLTAYFLLQILTVKRREWVLFLSAGACSLAVEMALKRIP